MRSRTLPPGSQNEPDHWERAPHTTTCTRSSSPFLPSQSCRTRSRARLRQPLVFKLSGSPYPVIANAPSRLGNCPSTSAPVNSTAKSEHASAWVRDFEEGDLVEEGPSGQGSWFERQERQAVRRAAQEGHEQEQGCSYFELEGIIESRWEEVVEWRPLHNCQQGRRHESSEGCSRPEGRKEVEQFELRAGPDRDEFRSCLGSKEIWAIPSRTRAWPYSSA
jgi:hypothetical protein